LNEPNNSTKPLSPAERDEALAQWIDTFREFGLTEMVLSPPRSQDRAPASAQAADSGAAPGIEQLEHLQRIEIGNCTRCKLHSSRKTIVFGEGDPNAELMLVGEAPGADEDDQGRPFVGRAGQLLMQMIKAINFERHQVYIANVLKCRPPGNRPPEPDEVKTCTPFLLKQISIIRPKIILALGTFAAQNLIDSKSTISLLRGRVYEMPFGRVIATYHPSFLLRSPNKKPEAWEDLKLVRKILSES
jgi:DNA polymerase